MCIWFIIAALNDLDISAADIGNVHSNVLCHEKECFAAGRKFGTNNIGRIVIIVWALYGLKSLSPFESEYRAELDVSP